MTLSIFTSAGAAFQRLGSPAGVVRASLEAQQA